MARGSVKERAKGGEAQEAAAGIELRIRRALDAGDLKGAASEALQAYGPQLLRYLRALLGSDGDAREAFAVTAERLWRSLSSFRGDASMRTWCFHLAWSAAADMRKEAWRRMGRQLETKDADQLGTGARTPSWLREERLHLVLVDLRKGLTLEEQSLLQLRVDQGLSFAECAEVMAAGGKAPSADTLQKRFERLKAKLKAQARERQGG